MDLFYGEHDSRIPWRDKHGRVFLKVFVKVSVKEASIGLRIGSNEEQPDVKEEYLLETRAISGICLVHG